MNPMLLWTFPILLAAGYAGAAFYLRGRAVGRLMRRRNQLAAGERDPRAEFNLVLLGTPSTALIALIGAALLVTLLPLDPAMASRLSVGLQVGLFAALALTGREALVFWADHATPRSLIAGRPARLALHTSLHVLCGLMMLAALGAPVVPVFALLAAALAVAGFGARETLSDYLAGIHVRMNAPVEPGDFIQIEDEEEGQVAQMDWVCTRVVTRRGTVLVIPNRKLLGLTIRSLGRAGRPVQAEVELLISPEVLLERALKSAEQAARQALDEAPSLAGPGDPIIVYDSISGRGSVMRVYVPARDFVSAGALRHLLLIIIHKRFKNDRIGFGDEEWRTAEKSPGHFSN